MKNGLPKSMNLHCYRESFIDLKLRRTKCNLLNKIFTIYKLFYPANNPPVPKYKYCYYYRFFYKE